MDEFNFNYRISLDLLRFIKVAKPTEEEMLKWLGVAQQGRYHILRKAGVLVVTGGIVQLSPKHCSEDGKRFWWGNKLYHLDEDKVDTF
jgi:hypothetical protein